MALYENVENEQSAIVFPIITHLNAADLSHINSYLVRPPELYTNQKETSSSDFFQWRWGSFIDGETAYFSREVYPFILGSPVYTEYAFDVEKGYTFQSFSELGKDLAFLDQAYVDSRTKGESWLFGVLMTNYLGNVVFISEKNEIFDYKTLTKLFSFDTDKVNPTGFFLEKFYYNQTSQKFMACSTNDDRLAVNIYQYTPLTEQEDYKIVELPQGSKGIRCDCSENGQFHIFYIDPNDSEKHILRSIKL